MNTEEILKTLSGAIQNCEWINRTHNLENYGRIDLMKESERTIKKYTLSTANYDEIEDNLLYKINQLNLTLPSMTTDISEYVCSMDIYVLKLHEIHAEILKVREAKKWL